jgi:hypothetical protein
MFGSAAFAKLTALSETTEAVQLVVGSAYFSFFDDPFVWIKAKWMAVPREVARRSVKTSPDTPTIPVWIVPGVPDEDHSRHLMSFPEAPGCTQIMITRPSESATISTSVAD